MCVTTNYDKGIENKAYAIFLKIIIIVHFIFVGINVPNNTFFLYDFW